MIYESGEDYLETILLLKKKNRSVRSIDIAHEFGYTKASISHYYVNEFLSFPVMNYWNKLFSEFQNSSSKKFINIILVKSYYNVPIYVNYRHCTLPRFSNHF